MEKRDLLESIKSHLKNKGFSFTYAYFDADWSIIVESLSISDRSGDSRALRNIPRVRLHNSLLNNFSCIENINMVGKDASAPLFSFRRSRYVKITLKESCIESISDDYEYWKNFLLLQCWGNG